jgi:GNAT superfamily N-acetyltransferase
LNVSIRVVDELPAQAAQLVDDGIGDYNEASAPIQDVRRLGCFAEAGGDVIGGAVGRTWGELAELQQLWLPDAQRGQGIGRRLMEAFEGAARGRGCTRVYLDTFTFQAPDFYRAMGYRVVLDLDGFAPGVRRFTMLKDLAP